MYCINEEGFRETANKMIYIGRLVEYDAEQFEEQLERLRLCSLDEESDIRKRVKEIVPAYHYET